VFFERCGFQGVEPGRYMIRLGGGGAQK